MEKIAEARVIERGASSLAIPLPAMLAKLFGATKGSSVEYFLENGRLVIVFPKAEAAEEGRVF